MNTFIRIMRETDNRSDASTVKDPKPLEIVRSNGRCRGDKSIDKGTQCRHVLVNLHIDIDK